MKFAIPILVSIALLGGGIMYTRGGDDHSRKDCPSIQSVVARYYTFEGDPRFQSRFDLNGDGVITVDDILITVECQEALLNN